MKVSWSVENFGYNLPVLISTLQENLYEIRQFTGLKLLDIELPISYADHYKGPAFGIAGCRKLTVGIQSGHAVPPFTYARAWSSKNLQQDNIV